MEIATLSRLASVSDLVGPGPFALSADGVDLAVVRTADGWRAFEGRCPHLGALLGEGELEGDHLVCRNHRWRFDVASGRRVGGPHCLSSCPVAERRGVLFADVSALRSGARSKPAARKIGELPGPPPLPLLGNVLQLLDTGSMHLVLERWAARYGPVYAFKVGRTPIVTISDPRLIDHLSRDRPETFRRPRDLDRVQTEIGIRGVFNAEGDVWRPQRKLVVAALSQRQLRKLYPHIRTVAERMHRRWLKMASQGAELDMVEELKRFTVDVMMLVTFDHDVNTVESNALGVHGRLAVILPMIGRRMLALVPTWRFVRLPSDRRFDRAVAELKSWLAGLLAAAKNRAAAGAPDSASFLDAMIAAKDEHGRPFSDEVIISNLFTLVLGGEDTTALTTAWAIHALLDHPEWMQRIRTEADHLLGDAPAPADMDAVNALSVAGAVANEAMRLRTVGPILTFEANADTVVGDMDIPRGTILAALPRPPAVSEAHFAHARAFMPQRWLEPPSGAHDLGAFMPFGSGPRLCPGRLLALTEMNTILALLCKNFDLERQGRAEDVKEVYGFVMSPGGLKVRLRSRR